jgi:hypothetical protein
VGEPEARSASAGEKGSRPGPKQARGGGSREAENGAGAGGEREGARRGAGAAKPRQRIEALTRANREHRDADRERRLLGLRHKEGIRLLRQASADPQFAAAEFDRLPGDSQLPEITPDELTASVLRAAILRNGCLLVRGMVRPTAAQRLADEIENAFAGRDAKEAGKSPPEGYFELFEAQAGYKLKAREWVTDAGGIWAADSPRAMFETLELFQRRGLRRLAREYLGERPVLSVEKCTLRKASPHTGHGYPIWHQDGAFMGTVRSLNVWLTFTRCGEDAPGLDIVPKRIDEVLPTGTEGAMFDTFLSQQVVDDARADVPVIRPRFEAGDMLLFDELFLHATAAEPEMPNHRYAIESWFFGPSAFPTKYTPLAP